MSQKSFVSELQVLTQYQQNNPGQIQSKSYYEQTTDGKKLKNIVIFKELFYHCNFSTSMIVGCVFTQCEFVDCNFTGCTIYNTNFENCKLINCNFLKVVMQDTHADTSYKSKCTFDDIDYTKNNSGFNESNVIAGQQIQVTNINPYAVVKGLMETPQYKNWKSTENDAYQLTFEDDENFGIALYPNQQKNKTDADNIWELDLFAGNESILMSDFNFYNLNQTEISNIINDWIKETVINQSSKIILARIFEILGVK